jgi:hypothetical protein
MSSSKAVWVDTATLRFVNDIGCIQALTNTREPIFLRRFEPIAQAIGIRLKEGSIEANHCKFLRTMPGLMNMQICEIYRVCDPIHVRRLCGLSLIEDGNHRAIALYLLGQRSVQAFVERETLGGIARDLILPLLVGFIRALRDVVSRSRPRAFECDCTRAR